jgi:putative N6-adenine-specific DNA methylase
MICKYDDGCRIFSIRTKQYILPIMTENKITLIATSVFGLEAVVKREVESLGFQNIQVADGRIEFDACIADIPKANLWLRCADRVLLKVGEFEAKTFDELFDGTKSLPWAEWITKDGVFVVDGKAVRSTLGSVRACQAIVKKAVAENLKENYKVEWLVETGAEFNIQISMLKDVALLTIDTSGVGLHKRGYREDAGVAPLKETLAAGLVFLSRWNGEQLLIDPMCGSGTILIEAVMIARNIAPGLRRNFVSEDWPNIEKRAWNKARREAKEAINKDLELTLWGYDIDNKNIKICRKNASNAGIYDDIKFEQKDIKDLWIDRQYGTVIFNPPYGVRLSEFKELNEIYISIHKTFKKKLGWSLFVLTSDEIFPNYFKRSRPDKIRKLYNGRIKVNYYQYRGVRELRHQA